MLFPEFHVFTLAFQAAHGHALGQLLLDADVEDQGGQHDHHQAGVHNTVLGGGLLGLHQIQQTDRQRPGTVGTAEQGQRDDVLIPEGQEVEEDDGDNGGLRHGEDDLRHGLAVASAIDIGSLLKVVGQGGKVAGEEVDGKGQGGGGVDDGQHHDIVEQEATAEGVLQPGIPIPQHQEDGHHDVVDVDEQSAHKAHVQEFPAPEVEPGQAVGGGQSHHQQDRQRQGSNDHGVDHVAAHAGLVPGIHEVLPVEAHGQGPGVAIELAVLLDGGQEHPGHRDDDTDSQEAQHQVNKDFVQPLAGGLLFHNFHMYTSPLRIPEAPAW